MTIGKSSIITRNLTSGGCGTGNPTELPCVMTGGEFLYDGSNSVYVKNGAGAMRTGYSARANVFSIETTNFLIESQNGTATTDLVYSGTRYSAFRVVFYDPITRRSHGVTIRGDLEGLSAEEYWSQSLQETLPDGLVCFNHTTDVPYLFQPAAGYAAYCVPILGSGPDIKHILYGVIDDGPYFYTCVREARIYYGAIVPSEFSAMNWADNNINHALCCDGIFVPMSVVHPTRVF